MVKNASITRKIKEAKEILKEIGLPSTQQNEISAITLLALCGIKPDDKWSDSYKHSLTISKGIMNFAATEYKKRYAPNTRETVRRQVLHQFIQAQITDYNPDDPALPTNSPRAHYAINKSALDVIKTFGTKNWKASLKKFATKHGNLAEKYRKRRTRNLVPVLLSNGKKLKLSPGKHNKVQAAVVHEFAPRFAPHSNVLYLGDTAKKNLYLDKKTLIKLGIQITEHDKLPDIVLFDSRKKWLFLIEAVTSHGPMSPKRVLELETMLKNCEVGKVFVTAFPNFTEFKRHTSNIAWETEVWLADIPDHMIHFDGERFFGPQ